MKQIETDYLIIGSGAVGLAFADTLLDETDAHITLVDRHAKPGGHWNDAYSFVTLHQPSAFYGVNSLSLGSNRKDTHGVNTGLYELASGPEVSGYFDKVMHQKLLSSGRVSYYPMSNYDGHEGGKGVFTSILSGVQTQVAVRKKTMDGTMFTTAVPSTRPPKYRVAPGVRLVPPNALAQLWMGAGGGAAAPERPERFVIAGAGKTAMDVGVFLQRLGVPPESIHWVMPRDSWLVNRLTTQPGPEFFVHSIGGQALQFEALAAATDIDDAFLRLEASGQMLRIFPDRKPTMFHYATISAGEVEVLARIKNVIRMGRVRGIDAEGLLLDGGRVAMPANTLYIDCTASAVEMRDIAPGPIFQDKKIILQLVRAPLVTFSAALVAYVEAHYPDDATKNRLCRPVPFPENLLGFAKSTLGNMMNQFQWSQDKPLRQWIRGTRLDGFGKLVADASADDADKQAILIRLKNSSIAAMGNITRLLAADSQPAR